MKKYTTFITCLALTGGLLSTPVFAQTDSGTSGAASPGVGGARQPDSSLGTTPGAGQSSSDILDSSRQPGAAINDPSGAQSQQEGVITIHGTVKSETEKQAIETQLKQLPGVMSVNNMLKVAGQEGQINEPSGAQPDQPQLNQPDSSDPNQLDTPDSDSDTDLQQTPPTPPTTP